jgi:hypothetical protein
VLMLMRTHLPWSNRRGVFLILFGAAFVLLGYALLTTDVTPALRHSLRLALNLAPLGFYAWAWITCGALGVIGGLLPRRLDALGFAAVIVMPTLWAVVYFVEWLAGDLPRGWQGSLLYALIAAAIGVVAGMPDPTDLPVARDPQ